LRPLVLRTTSDPEGVCAHAQTAIKVTDGSIEVVSEGHWKLLNPGIMNIEQGSVKVGVPIM